MAGGKGLALHLPFWVEDVVLGQASSVAACGNLAGGSAIGGSHSKPCGR